MFSVISGDEDTDADLDVDVTTCEKITAFVSSDEEEETENLLFLPIAPEIDEPEDSGPLNTVSE